MFSWNPPQEDLQNGVITGYRISCMETGSTGDSVMDDSQAINSETLSGLVPATHYNCSLSAETSVGFGVATTVQVLTSEFL